MSADRKRRTRKTKSLIIMRWQQWSPLHIITNSVLRVPSVGRFPQHHRHPPLFTSRFAGIIFNVPFTSVDDLIRQLLPANIWRPRVRLYVRLSAYQPLHATITLFRNFPSTKTATADTAPFIANELIIIFK